MEAELLDSEIEAANIRITMSRSDEAIEILNSGIQKLKKESTIWAFVFVSMAKALCS